MSYLIITDRLIMKSLPTKTPKVYKNKKLNNASFSDFTLNDYQVFLQLITKIGGVDEVGKYIQSSELERTQTLTAQEFASIFHLDVKHAYQTIKKAASKLVKSTIILQKPELFETWEISICNMAKYNHKAGSITVEFTEHIMPYLAQVRQKFVLYNLREISNFSSLYSTRLYELIQEFKDTGWLEKTVQDLRNALGVTDTQYKLYGDFKKRCVLKAVNEINQLYNLQLTFDEKKEGKSVQRLLFRFNNTVVRQGVNPLTGELKNIYIKPGLKQPKLI